MARPAKYNHDVTKMIAQMRVIFGTPRTAYERLRAAEAGCQWQAFSYAWHNGRTDFPTKNVLGVLWPAYWEELQVVPSRQDLEQFFLTDTAVAQAKYWADRMEEHHG